MPHELYGMKVDASGLLLSDELKLQIVNACQHKIDFLLFNGNPERCCFFLQNKYMVTMHDGSMSFTHLSDYDLLMSAISLQLAIYRQFKPLTDVLDNTKINKLKELAYLKCLH